MVEEEVVEEMVVEVEVMVLMVEAEREEVL